MKLYSVAIVGATGLVGQEFIKVLAPILEIQSKRLDRLEGHP